MNIPHMQRDVVLAPYTTFTIGGPADYFVVVTTADEMIHAVNEARAAGIPYVILGGGSDVLVHDDGFRGLVIKSEMRTIDIDQEAATVRADSGVLISTLIRQTLKSELTGIEYAIGVPATVGGAIWANLGARGTEIADLLLTTRAIDQQGTVHTLTAEECEFTYRDSRFKREPWVILEGTFQLQTGDRAEIADMMKNLATLRKETQDVGAKCAGCVFRNPTDQTDVPAAKLIDDLGLKGYRIGDAQVSETHANFILNVGEATADQVVQLISYVKQQVRDKAGIQLHEEVEYIGF